MSELQPPGGHQNRDPEAFQREVARDLGLLPGKLISNLYDSATCPYIGQIIREHMFAQLVDPEQVKKLHPELSPEIAKDTAIGLNVGILVDRCKMILDGSPVARHSDLQQVVAGATMMTMEALTCACLGLGINSREVLDEADRRRIAGGPAES